MANKRILVISDLHAPYQHPDALSFLDAVAQKYAPDKIVNIGDELDFHAVSFHDTDPDADGAGPELLKARKTIAQLEKMFPRMDILESNHGSLVYRRARANGLSRLVLKSYNEVLAVGPGWQWHLDLTLRMSDGNAVYFHHGKDGDAYRLSRNVGMSAVSGHYHSSFGAKHWGNSLGLYWGMQVGCLVDDTSMAMAYNKLQIQRPVIGTGIIIDGQPKLLPLVMRKGGRWDRKVH